MEPVLRNALRWVTATDMEHVRRLRYVFVNLDGQHQTVSVSHVIPRVDNMPPARGQIPARATLGLRWYSETVNWCVWIRVRTGEFVSGIPFFLAMGVAVCLAGVVRIALSLFVPIVGMAIARHLRHVAVAQGGRVPIAVRLLA